MDDTTASGTAPAATAGVFLGAGGETLLVLDTPGTNGLGEQRIGQQWDYRIEEKGVAQ
jgi:hypothetical protein